jgi:hypothetical protein
VMSHNNRKFHVTNPPLSPRRRQAVECPNLDREFCKLISCSDKRTSSVEFTAAQQIKIFPVFYITQIITKLP